MIRLARLTLARLRHSFVSPYIVQASHASFITTRNEIDFHGIEAKWRVKWAAKESKIDNKNPYRPLAPLGFSMLGVRKPYGNNEKDELNVCLNEARYLFDRRLPFAKPIDSEGVLELCKSDQQLKSYIQHSGRDPTRTSTIFSAHGVPMQPQFFESIWKAISFAHQSYLNTQADHTYPNVPDALYKYNSEAWNNHLINGVESLVHIPLDEKPDICRPSNEDSDKVWLAAQEAVVAFKNHTNVNKKALIMKRLGLLIDNIIGYDSAEVFYPEFHYHAARILTNLVTAFALSFAEECWVILHYGEYSWLDIHDNAITSEDDPAEIEEDEEDEEDDEDDEIWEPHSLDDIERSLENAGEWESYRNLPRRWYPETLALLFELAPSTTDSSEARELLKRRFASCKGKESSGGEIDEGY
ncbi:MAG: hypothetical protein Q9168_007144 [Polycauliona sp. 1 TL-2023]